MEGPDPTKSEPKCVIQPPLSAAAGRVRLSILIILDMSAETLAVPPWLPAAPITTVFPRTASEGPRHGRGGQPRINSEEPEKAVSGQHSDAKVPVTKEDPER